MLRLSRNCSLLETTGCPEKKSLVGELLASHAFEKPLCSATLSKWAVMGNAYRLLHFSV